MPLEGPFRNLPTHRFRVYFCCADAYNLQSMRDRRHGSMETVRMFIRLQSSTRRLRYYGLPDLRCTSQSASTRAAEKVTPQVPEFEHWWSYGSRADRRTSLARIFWSREESHSMQTQRQGSLGV